MVLSRFIPRGVKRQHLRAVQRAEDDSIVWFPALLSIAVAVAIAWLAVIYFQS